MSDIERFRELLVESIVIDSDEEFIHADAQVTYYLVGPEYSGDNGNTRWAVLFRCDEVEDLVGHVGCDCPCEKGKGGNASCAVSCEHGVFRDGDSIDLADLPEVAVWLAEPAPWASEA